MVAALFDTHSCKDSRPDWRRDASILNEPESISVKVLKGR